MAEFVNLRAILANVPSQFSLAEQRRTLPVEATALALLRCRCHMRPGPALWVSGFRSGGGPRRRWSWSTYGLKLQSREPGQANILGYPAYKASTRPSAEGGQPSTIHPAKPNNSSDPSPTAQKSSQLDHVFIQSRTSVI